MGFLGFFRALGARMIVNPHNVVESSSDLVQFQADVAVIRMNPWTASLQRISWPDSWLAFAVRKTPVGAEQFPDVVTTNRVGPLVVAHRGDERICPAERLVRILDDRRPRPRLNQAVFVQNLVGLSRMNRGCSEGYKG
jgi:hypothetical protein